MTFFTRLHSTVMRRCAALALSVLALGSGAAHAGYPDHPITVIVTYPPGGTVDAVARIIAPTLSAKLGQPIVIENRGGAGGMIGGSVVAHSKPDGYTLMLDASNYAQNPALHSKMPFDTLADFTPVSLLIRVPNVLVVTPGFDKVHTVADLIKLDKANPGKPISFASAGPGSAQHLAGELFNQLAGTHLQHIAYKGGGPAMIDVMSGQVPVMFASLGSAWPHIKDGKLRAIAVGGTVRSPTMPDLPTIAESGVPGFASYEWNAVFAPAGTPAPIVNRLSKALAETMKTPSVAQALTGMGAEIIASSPADLDKFRRAEIEKWQKLARKAHISLD
ncbi:MAG: tripartite tricarboxylate transporter substrate binding protein [Bordetella sp.]|uniref:tripartite tricarboxylate transporter substrate binding protein n=1 Tax=Bordetella sp. TaxID=28081 RepID=UPI003F7C81F2